MLKRNVWEHEETKAMLSIMEEQNATKLFDGKVYRNAEIYKKIERELIKRGYTTKNNKQIEIRWKNLKRNYINAKKMNNKSGNNRELCPFYEELDRMLGCRPSVNVINSGIDTSRNQENEAEASDDPPQEPLCPSSPIPSTSAECTTNGVQRKEPRPSTSGRGTYARCIEKLGATIKNTQEALNKDFFESQKKLIDYEFNLYMKKEEELEEKFNAATKQLLEESTNKFLVGLSDILKSGNNSATSESLNIREFINNFSVDE